MREYRVFLKRCPNTRKVLEYFVSQKLEEENRSECPSVAIFPVTPRYDNEAQMKRAEDYCEYMNKLVEAEKIAYDQNQLVNILKS